MPLPNAGMTTICRGAPVCVPWISSPVMPGRHTGLPLRNSGYFFNIRLKYGSQKILGRFQGCFGPFLPVRGGNWLISGKNSEKPIWIKELSDVFSVIASCWICGIIRQNQHDVVPPSKWRWNRVGEGRYYKKVLTGSWIYGYKKRQSHTDTPGRPGLWPLWYWKMFE